MKLYVMRHGSAEDEAPSGRDADRALTASGRERTRNVARALVGQNEAPLTILSSPLVRALQTAEIVAAVTDHDRRDGSTGVVEVRRELAPGGDALALTLEMLRAGRKRVMVVGHEPDLSTLVSSLVARVPEQGMLKSMVVGIKVEAAPVGAPSATTASFRFVLDPKTLEWQRS